MGIVFAEIKLILRVILWIGILIGVTLICHLMWPDLKKARVIPGQAALPDPKADQDVTMFREGLLRHGVSSDSGPEIAGKLKWMIDTEKTGSIFSWGPFVYSTPAVREGLVYFGAWDGMLYSANILTGEIIWTYSSGGYLWFLSGSWLNSSPTIAGDTVYFGNRNGSLYAIDSQNGMERWRFKTPNSIPGSPLVVDGAVYFGNMEGHFFKIDAITGELIWELRIHELPKPTDRIGAIRESINATLDKRGGITSSPTLDDGIVYFGSRNGLFYAVDANSGEIVWRFAGGGRGFDSSPVINGNQVYAGNYDGNLYALNKKTGSMVWAFETEGGVHSSPSLYQGNLYFGSWGGKFFSVSADEGKLNWEYNAKAQIDASPLIANGTVYIGDYWGNLLALDTDTGKLKWKFKTGAKIRGSATKMDGMLFFGSFDGKLYALE